MNKNDIKEFSSIMNGLSANFGGTLDPGLLKMYFIALQKYNINQLKDSAIWLLQNKKEREMPLIFEIIDVIEGRHNKPDIKATAQIQCDIAIKALKQYGGSRIETIFEHPITNYLMTQKWSYKTKADTILTSQFNEFRMEFLGAFKAYSEQKVFDKEMDKSIEDFAKDKQLNNLTHNILKEIN